MVQIALFEPFFENAKTYRSRSPRLERDLLSFFGSVPNASYRTQNKEKKGSNNAIWTIIFFKKKLYFYVKHIGNLFYDFYLHFTT